MTPPDGIQLVTEARAQALCGLTRPGWKSWAKSGLIEEDPGGVYDERQLLEVAIVGGLRKHLSPKDTRVACQALKRTGGWEELITAAQMLGDDGRFDLVIEPDVCAVTLVRDDAELVGVVRDPSAPRLVLVLPLADRLRRIRDGFRSVAETRERPRQRKVGRPAKRKADVVQFPEQSA
jgi:hypothetical protein